MFLSYELRECQDCGSISDTLCLLDRAISRESRKLYRTYVYLESDHCSREKLHTLVHFKAILTKLVFNSKFYPNYSYKEIVSKVKTLI